MKSRISFHRWTTRQPKSIRKSRALPSILRYSVSSSCDQRKEGVESGPEAADIDGRPLRRTTNAPTVTIGICTARLCAKM
eukprot:553426-Amorphochlora_amoeboformis.AAC.2